ncbi:MAG: 50S ribosomal protein L3 [Planctomycetes bacterium]|nr:50S ribosomal protein L3 [Planctomycetota bacterium]
MLPAILGKKVGMTQVYDQAGKVQPVTVVQAGPCTVLEIRQADKAGYCAVQMGFDDVRPQRARKPQVGQALKAKSRPKHFIREFRADSTDGFEIGSQVTVDAFDGIEFVDVVGTTKGKGFAGVMKRHHFAGLPASHGTERKHRSPGSQSAHATNRGWGGDIKKGKRMSGHMGNTRCTSRNHRLVGIDKENGLLLIKGSVPGPSGGYVMVHKSKTARVKTPAGK